MATENNFNSGWISLYRQLSETKLWLGEPFTRGQAWVDLMMLAQYKDGSFWKRGVLVEFKRGTVTISQEGLADRWGWSRKKVSSFLSWLETEHQIEQQKNNITTLIYLTNYEYYQSREQQKEQQKHTRSTPEAHQKHTYNKDNKDNKVNKEEDIFCHDQNHDASNLSEKSKTKEQNKEFKELAIKALEVLNDLTGKDFRPVDSNLNPIIAKFKSGCTFDQVEAVIGDRYNKWRNDPKMQEYIRPSTIFRASNFESYLAEARKEFKV